MRRALLRLSCLLATAAAVRDAEDDMDRQLQMFASRYMFATDGQISEGLDREMNDHWLSPNRSPGRATTKELVVVKYRATPVFSLGRQPLFPRSSLNSKRIAGIWGKLIAGLLTWRARSPHSLSRFADFATFAGFSRC